MSDETAGDSADWVTEHRYRAVLQVLDGVPKSQVARECGSRPVEWCKSGRVSACGSVVATMP
ncbi:hypothetical protein FCV16_00820 [Mycobacterium avium subsp. hominissuis]|nr:hypothetical protein FCV16_00820 [Mycobacterium avium subsp. hominissuis]QCR82673.1 hypothetical protein FCV18_17460 [Mycobacterium avium subsp. hominissuis]